MNDSDSKTDIDPELEKQLNSAAASNEPVEAVFRLKPDDPSQIVPSPERTKQIVESILKRVKSRIGKSAARHNIFTNLGSFAVAASPDFVRNIISQPEVVAAVANRQPYDASMPPIDVKSSEAVKQRKTRPSAQERKKETSARPAADRGARKPVK